MEVRKEGEDEILPDIKIILQKFLLSLIATPHVVSPALVGDQLPVRLDHHGVEVLHAVQDIGGHGVAGSEGQSVLDEALRNDGINISSAG